MKCYSVSDYDIEKGIFMDSKHCPLANSLRRNFPETNFFSVGSGVVSIKDKQYSVSNTLGQIIRDYDYSAGIIFPKINYVIFEYSKLWKFLSRSDYDGKIEIL